MIENKAADMFSRKDDNQLNAVLEENQFRMLCYELIKIGFSYPTDNNYKALKKTSLKNVIKGEMLSFLGDLPPLPQLEVTYTTFFDVVYNGRGCHLREGEYLKNKMSISKLLLECKGFYKNFGLYLQPNELPDTLEIELEFMYYLTYLIIKEYSKGGFTEKVASILKAQKDFIERHLVHFISSLQECTSKYDELSFYFKLSSFSKDFLLYDVDFIELSLNKYEQQTDDKQT